MTGWRKKQIDKLKAGSELMAGDGGYSIGTEEGYKNMVRQRSEALVISLIGKEFANNWWTGYNYAFGRTPNEQWDLEYRVVYNYLMGAASGNFS